MRPTKEAQLISAVESYDVDAVSSLLKSGADPNAANSIRQSVMQIALERGNATIIELVANCPGVDLNAAYSLKNLPLHTAVLKGFHQILPLMKQKGANIDLTDVSTLAPIHVAALHKQVESAKVLINLGVDINAKTGVNEYSGFYKYTALHLAAENGDLEMAKLLISNGIDVQVKSERGLTARDLFRLRGQEMLEKFDAIIEKSKVARMDSSARTSSGDSHTRNSKSPEKQENKDTSQEKQTAKRKTEACEINEKDSNHSKKTRTKEQHYTRKHDGIDKTLNNGSSSLGRCLGAHEPRLVNRGTIHKSTTNLQRPQEKQKRSNSKAHIIHTTYRSNSDYEASTSSYGSSRHTANGR